ncbi:MAG TPA: glycoside hydrolase family 88 protein [Pelobium sp.]|nr:glycoside hydrolase family 88 protein [Pelobium sp.]
MIRIKKVTGFVFSVLLLFASESKGQAISKDSVLQVMNKVAHWQINEWKEGRIIKLPKTEWENGAMYTGFVALKKVDPQPIYDKFLYNIGEELNWNTGKNKLFADDYVVAQMYTAMYMENKEPKMIAKWQAQADSIVNKPFAESLKIAPQITHREWAWCDALFMGPPGLAMLSRATGEIKYLKKADSLWWKTSNFLYDRKEHLYYRDSRFFDKIEANGKKVFWSRGNGWVLAGLARMMENMPNNFDSKKKYQKQFQQMAKKIACIQQPDGSWHSSLYDPETFNLKESSGTAFFCYGIAWGINHGLLSKKKYQPIVENAWNALLTSIHPNGKLGYVQPIGDKPVKAGYESTDVYGVGAFLLAGSEVYKLFK